MLCHPIVRFLMFFCEPLETLNTQLTNLFYTYSIGAINKEYEICYYLDILYSIPINSF